MGCSVSWFAAQRPKEDLHTRASCEGCDVAGRNSERANVASVRLTEKVMEPREDKARWFCIRREVELAKRGFSKDCEGCRVAALGDEVARPHGKECRERIGVAMTCNDAGQQREVAQESRDEDMNEANVTNNAENVKPRVEIGKIRPK